MKRQLSIPALALAVALAAAPAQADVKKEERNQVSFAGMLGQSGQFLRRQVRQGRRRVDASPSRAIAR